jgi:L-aminopeptidase/D-esterase-like protein
MQFLHERDVGFDVGVTKVPIVPGAVIFDLGLGALAWPDAAMGYRACRAAGSGSVEQGCVGAGTGATVGKLLGLAHATKSGVGTASVALPTVVVGALVVVNAMGDVIQPGTDVVIAGARGSDGSPANAMNALLETESSDPTRYRCRHRGCTRQ